MTTTQDEKSRVGALRRLRAWDEDSQGPQERLVDLAASLFGVPHVAIHLIDEEHQWAAAFHGRDFTCDRDQSFCQYTIDQDKVLVVPDARADPRFRDLSLVHEDQPILFYAGAPLITRDGYRVGSFCLIDHEPHSDFSDEQTKQLQQFARVVVEIMELRRDQYRTHEALERATELDPITGLRNRFSLLRALRHHHEQSDGDAAVGILILRLDRMERIHGGFGEDCRNEVLRETGRRLAALITDEELLSRGDGDTFIIGWCHSTSHPGEPFDCISAWGEARSRQVHEAIAAPYQLANEQAQLTVSIGLARSGAGGGDPFEALEATHTAAGSAQLAGGDCTMWFADTLSDSLRQQVSIETRLREAVAAEAFALVYQPIVDIDQSGRVVGAEALLRWPGQDMPVASPGFFVPLAEEIGLMHRLTRWVFQRACRDQRRLERAGLAVWLSINLSPVELTEAGLADELAGIAHQEGVDPRNIKLEITEGALTQDFDEVTRRLEALKARGFLLSLDDFGTGFSSLTRVVRLPFDSIKIDRGFVSDSPGGPGGAVVSAVADLSANLGMTPIAEGVESALHEQSLRDESIALAQGFRYSPGVAIDAFEAYAEASTGHSSGPGVGAWHQADDAPLAAQGTTPDDPG